MPIPTPDQLRERAHKLKKELAAGIDSMEGPRVRAVKKRIRRLQRRRRKMLSIAHRAAKAKKTPEAAEQKSE